ncbi:MAG: hypothetical protein U1E47_05240 [Rivihabitans pingtungensis]
MQARQLPKTLTTDPALMHRKNRYRTLAVSVQVTRASRFEVNKKDGTDIYLPLTLSLYFQQPADR